MDPVEAMRELARQGRLTPDRLDYWTSVLDRTGRGSAGAWLAGRPRHHQSRRRLGGSPGGVLPADRLCPVVRPHFGHASRTAGMVPDGEPR